MNITFVDFCGNRKGMEKPDLWGIHSSWSWLDEDFYRGFSSYFRHRLFSVGLDYGFQFEHTLIGENETAFSDELVGQDLELGDGGSESIYYFELPVVKIKIFHVGLQGLYFQRDGFFHHGIFTDHQFSASF